MKQYRVKKTLGTNNAEYLQLYYECLRWTSKLSSAASLSRHTANEIVNLLQAASNSKCTNYEVEEIKVKRVTDISIELTTTKPAFNNLAKELQRIFERILIFVQDDKTLADEPTITLIDSDGFIAGEVNFKFTEGDEDL